MYLLFPKVPLEGYKGRWGVCGFPQLLPPWYILFWSQKWVRVPTLSLAQGGYEERGP
jgi:hypothetical protein